MVTWNLWHGKTGEIPNKTYPESRLCFVDHETHIVTKTGKLVTSAVRGERLFIANNWDVLRIFGAIETEDGWRARYNDELYELYKEANLETHIRCQRLRWLRHIIRMENTSKVKIVFNNNPEGARLGGRPRTRWWNCVRVDLNRFE